MPLRDHFSETIPKRFRWEGFHSTWPVTMVRHLNRGVLPPGYHAEPRVRLATLAEVDVGTREELSTASRGGSAGSNGGVAVYSPPAPVLTVETEDLNFPNREEHISVVMDAAFETLNQKKSAHLINAGERKQQILFS